MTQGVAGKHRAVRRLMELPAERGPVLRVNSLPPPPPAHLLVPEHLLLDGDLEDDLVHGARAVDLRDHEALDRLARAVHALGRLDEDARAVHGLRGGGKGDGGGRVSTLLRNNSRKGVGR